MKNAKSIIAHLLPLGTPPILIPIIVFIELVRQIIRPITLAVRLTANIVAGHLLIRLLGSFSLTSISISIIRSPLIIALTFLEICVSAIQAFVFITLLTLYSTEIN
jgi:F-type H+-transporting ATPase subunit a